MQTNDIELTQDGGALLAGHHYSLAQAGCTAPGCKWRIDGAMMKVDENYNVEWTKRYGNYPGGVNQYTNQKKSFGDSSFIYNECFGVAPIKVDDEVTGYLLACGSGIEGCGNGESDLDVPNPNWLP